jgi:segregation and condensation protein B
MEDALDKQEDMQATEATDSAADEQAGLGACDADAGDDDASGAAEAQGADEPGASASAEAEIAATVEAILFATDNPLSPAKIALLAELPNRGLVKRAVAQLNERYDRMGCSFCIEPIAGGYQMLTRPQYHDVVSRLFKNKSDSKLSQAAMETLAIVAYRQPVLRADIEAVRGVASGEMLRGLMEKNLVKIVGRAEVLGRPMLYGTTRQFLEVFGLNGIDDLPNVESLRGGRDANANAKRAAAAAQDADEAGAQQPAPADSKPDAQPQPPQPEAVQEEEPLID